MQVEDPALAGVPHLRSRCCVREERRVSRMEKYAARRSDRRQRRLLVSVWVVSPSTLLRTVSLPNSLSNGR